MSKFIFALLLSILMVSCANNNSINEINTSNNNLVTDGVESINISNASLIVEISKNASVMFPESECGFLEDKSENANFSATLDEHFETNEYSYLINSNWRDFSQDLKGGFPGESYFSLEGRGFPAFYNGIVTAQIWSITETKYQNLEEAKDDWTKGIVFNEERDFSDSPKALICKTKIKSGEDAYFIRTNFFRTTKELNYHRYDILAYKDGKTITITITIGHSADYEDIRENIQLDFVAKSVFKSLYLN